MLTVLALAVVPAASASAPLGITGTPVELTVRAVNESTVRISLVPVDDNEPARTLPANHFRRRILHEGHHR